jgi:hypothetical protein
MTRSIQFTSLVLLAWSCHAFASTLYVDLNSTSPTPPYADWSTAATNIQDAIDASVDGDLVLVTNGIYNGGSESTSDGVSTRVIVTRAVTLQSVNGSAATVIDGGRLARCVYLTNGAALSGFTLTNGYAPSGGFSGGGGGIDCASTNCWVANSLMISNSAYSGGGIKFGTVSNCVISYNSTTGASGGGAESSVLIHCTLANNSASLFGGGASGDAILNNCTVAGNFAMGGGGGVFGSTLNDCLVISNSSPMHPAANGGGALSCILNNCTISANSAFQGGGVYFDPQPGFIPAAYNCIIYYNYGVVGPDTFSSYMGPDASSLLMTNCCSSTVSSSAGNITNAPLFVNLSGGDFHLLPNSPCINTGNNNYVSTTNDLDGNPRIRGGTVDMGAYEFQAQATGTFAAWLQQYGLPIDGSADDADSDADGMNNWQEWLAGTIPTNAASVLVMLPPVATGGANGVTVSWQSVNTRTYNLQRVTNLASPSGFSVIQSNLVGEASSTSFTDTSATNGGPYFYRVGVQ